MTDTYALTVSIESYDYDGEFYLVGEGYGTPSEVLRHVAAAHLLRIDEASVVEAYLLDVLNAGENTSKDEYESVDADVECGIHVNVDYHRFSFWVGDRVFEIGEHPTKSSLEAMADDLRSESIRD